MKLNISDWESFCASDIFFLYNGSGITKEEIEDNPGSFPAVQSGADNNGCIGYISKDYCKAMNFKRNADGIVFDETHEFSDDGYIPDWEWMDSYMRSLPYSDRL